MGKIVCFTLGLSDKDREKGKTMFRDLTHGAQALDAVVITEDLLAARVGEMVDGGGPGTNTAEGQSTGKEIVSREHHTHRAVIINTVDRRQVLEIMKSFKAVLHNPRDVIFAMVTDIARTWTFGEYIEHLEKEHEYMKTHDPVKDPHMKRM